MKGLNNQSEKYFQFIKDYRKEGKALAHFNISNLDQARAIVEVAEELGEPVIIGASQGERDYMGVGVVRKIIDGLNDEFSVPIFLSADHTYTFEKIKEVVEAGYDSVIIDGAKLPYEANVALVKACVDFIREYEKKNNVKVITEAELGYIGQTSSLNKKLPDGVELSNLTTIEQAKDFIERTGIDMFAPSVGNIHGMMVGQSEPELNIERIKELGSSLETPLVLHGASGNTDEELKNAITAGISIIHISTEIRKAFRDGEKDFMDNHPDEVAPYKFGKEGQEEVKKVVRAKMKLYSGK